MLGPKCFPRFHDYDFVGKSKFLGPFQEGRAVKKVVWKWYQLSRFWAKTKIAKNSIHRWLCLFGCLCGLRQGWGWKASKTWCRYWYSQHWRTHCPASGKKSLKSCQITRFFIAIFSITVVKSNINPDQNRFKNMSLWQPNNIIQYSFLSFMDLIF